MQSDIFYCEVNNIILTNMIGNSSKQAKSLLTQAFRTFTTPPLTVKRLGIVGAG
jgi:3-hydroxybutyryl-CoA dehydrogenase